MAKILSILPRMSRQATAMWTAMALLLGSLTACIDTFDAALPASETQLVVIEGRIIGDSTCTFYLSHTFALDDSIRDISKQYILDAFVNVLGSDGTVFTGQCVEAGKYEVKVGTLNPDNFYWLDVLCEGEHYESAALKPLVTPEIAELTFSQPREDQVVDILVTPADSDTRENQYYCWTSDQWWEVHTPYQSHWTYDPESDSVVQAIPELWRGYHHDKSINRVIGSNADYREGHIRDLRLYSRGHCEDCFVYLYYTHVTQTAISAEEYEYIKLNQQQSEEMGGLFTPLPSELPSNITCTSNSERKAIGYIGVCANATHRELYIRRREVGYRSPYYIMINSLEDLQVETFAKAFEIGYRLLNYDKMTGENTWVKRFAVDCTTVPWNCTLERPEFWKDE